MKKRRFSKIAALVSLVLTSMVTLTVAMTAAAFLTFEKHQQQVEINMDYSSYFGSNDPNVKADGSVNNPFVISTPDHLRNLSYLVNMGVFNETHNFNLKTFTYDSKALTPIGTDQSPFKSHFYGDASGSNSATVPSIKNLVVEGNNLSDVGLFGVVGASARIHDFILDSPTINVSGTAPYNADKIDQNPLRDITATYQGSDYIFSKANVSSQITLANTTPVKDGQNIVGTTALTLSRGTLPVEYAFDNQNKMPLTYYCSSSNEALVTMSGDINTGDVTFTVNTQATNPDTSKNPKVGDYVIIEIGVRGIVPTPNGNRYAQMTLERFKLYYEYKKNYVIADAKDARMYKKMIHTPIVQSKENDSNMLLEDDSKGIYVGAVIGMLYGDARRIGVYNATLNIKRPFISNSILVGRTLDDDENKNMTKEDLEIPKIIKSSDDKLNFMYSPQDMINYPGIKDADSNMGNRLVTNIYGADGLANQSRNTIRIYGTRRPDNSAGSLNPTPVPDNEGVTLTRNKVYTGKKADGKTSNGIYMVEENRTSTNYTTATLPAITFKSTMHEELHHIGRANLDKPIAAIYGNGYKDMSISNSIMLWLSGADGKTGIYRWIRNGIDFYLDIEIDYSMYIDQDIAPGNYANIELGIEGTRKHIGPYTAKTYFNTWTFYYDPPKNEIKAANDPSGEASYHMDVVYPTGKSKDKYAYAYGFYEDPKGKSAADNRNVTRFDTSVINGKVSEKDMPDHVSKIYTKHIKIKSETASFFESTNKSVTGMYPLFFIGPKHYGEFTQAIDERIQQNPMPPAPKIENFRLDIYGMRVTLSDLKGNINSTIGQIDFTDNATTLPITSNGWNGSNIKVGAKTIENSKVVANNVANTTKLMNVHSEANGITNYKIVTSKSGNNVTITWNPIGAKASQFAYIQPRANIKYNNLTVTQNTNL